MKYSNQKRLELQKVGKKARRGSGKLAFAGHSEKPSESNLPILYDCLNSPDIAPPPYLLFLGGTSARDLEVRKAQAALRMDGMPSDWSQLALISQKPKSLDQPCGLEVSLCPQAPETQAPERNGVTVFSLAKYADARRYPNVAIVAFAKSPTPPKLADSDSTQPAAKTNAQLNQQLSDMLTAACNPMQDRLRYRLWEWLGAWASYTYAPLIEQNPILRGIPHPGAAFCEYAFECGRVDLTPNASEPAACPETVWAAVLHFHNVLQASLSKPMVWAERRQQGHVLRSALSVPIDIGAKG